MLRGIYAAASAMLVGEKRLDVVANNLANATTTGFKRDTTLAEPFPALLLKRVNDRSNSQPPTPQRVGPLGLGAFVSVVATRLADGAINHTGNPLDVAITGDGFFAVMTPQGVRYTRQGSFVQDGEGRLSTPEGYAVMVNGEAVTAPQGSLSIDDQGDLWSGDRLLGRLTIATSLQLGALRKEGNGLWAQAGAAQGPQVLVPTEGAGAYQLRAGYLEASNVDPTTEMVEMMVTLRSFEASQRAIQIQDETLRQAANEIGRIG